MTSTQPAKSANPGDVILTPEALDKYGILAQFAWVASLWSGKVTAPARRQIGSPITLAEGEDKLVDADDDVVQFNGPTAPTTAAAYYAQAGLTYAELTGATVPAWVAPLLRKAQEIESGQRAAAAGAKRALALATARGLAGTPAKTKARRTGTTKPATTRTRTARTAQPEQPPAPAAAPTPREDTMTATAKATPRPRATAPKTTPKATAPKATAPVVPAAPAPRTPAPAAVVAQGRLGTPQCEVSTCSAPSALLVTYTAQGKQVVTAVCAPHVTVSSDAGTTATCAPIAPDGVALHTISAQNLAPGTMPWAMPAELAAAWTVTRVESYLNKRNQARVRWLYANGQAAMFAFDEQVTGHYVPGELPTRR